MRLPPRRVTAIEHLAAIGETPVTSDDRAIRLSGALLNHDPCRRLRAARRQLTELCQTQQLVRPQRKTDLPLHHAAMRHAILHLLAQANRPMTPTEVHAAAQTHLAKPLR